MSKPFSMWDRTVYGAVAALFGSVFGLAAALLLAMSVESIPPVRLIVISSASYFFCIGVFLGSDAGFFVGEALTSIAGIAAAETGIVPGETANSDEPRSWKSPILLAVWVCMILVLAWRG